MFCKRGLIISENLPDLCVRADIEHLLKYHMDVSLQEVADFTHRCLNRKVQ